MPDKRYGQEGPEDPGLRGRPTMPMPPSRVPARPRRVAPAPAPEPEERPDERYAQPDERYALPAPPLSGNAPSLPPASEPYQPYAPPAQQYAPPEQPYTPPAQQYGPPAQQYAPPAQQYGPPAPFTGSASALPPGGPGGHWPYASSAPVAGSAPPPLSAEPYQPEPYQSEPYQQYPPPAPFTGLAPLPVRRESLAEASPPIRITSPATSRRPEPIAEPTQMLRILPKTVLAPPSRSLAPPPAAGRAVIVYEPQIRRPWRLWVFTLGIVALTVGVILGQAVAYQPETRSSSNAQAGTVPADSPPSEAVAPGAAVQGAPTAGQEASVPLGKAKTRTLSVTGASAMLRIRSVTLGQTLINVTTMDGSASPKLSDSDKGTNLELVPTGAAGSAGAEIQVNASVAWTIKIIGGSNAQEIDMRTGGLAGIEFVGGATQVVLQLPKPKGTVPLKISQPISQLTIQTADATPVRLKLGGGAETVTMDGKVQQKVAAGKRITPATWASTKARYDVVATAVVNNVSVAPI